MARRGPRVVYIPTLRLLLDARDMINDLRFRRMWTKAAAEVDPDATTPTRLRRRLGREDFRATDQEEEEEGFII